MPKSTILARYDGNGLATFIYCHSSKTKPIAKSLRKYYEDPDKIDRLFAMGDLMLLRSTTARTEAYANTCPNLRLPMRCLEVGILADKYDIYLYRGSEWRKGDHGKWERI